MRRAGPPDYTFVYLFATSRYQSLIEARYTLTTDIVLSWFRCSMLLLVLATCSLVNYSIAQTLSLKREGNDAEFLCESLDGTPLSSIQWFFNGSIDHCCIANAQANPLIMRVSPDCEGLFQCGGNFKGTYQVTDTRPVYGIKREYLYLL